MFRQNKPKVVGRKNSNGRWVYSFRCPVGLCDTKAYRWRIAYTLARECNWLGHYEFDLPHLQTHNQRREWLEARKDADGHYSLGVLRRDG